MRGLPVDGGLCALGLFAPSFSAVEHVEAVANRCQWIAQFVGKHGQKLVLALVGLAQPLVGDPQLLFRALALGGLPNRAQNAPALITRQAHPVQGPTEIRGLQVGPGGSAHGKGLVDGRARLARGQDLPAEIGNHRLGLGPNLEQGPAHYLPAGSNDLVGWVRQQDGEITSTNKCRATQQVVDDGFKQLALFLHLALSLPPGGDIPAVDPHSPGLRVKVQRLRESRLAHGHASLDGRFSAVLQRPYRRGPIAKPRMPKPLLLQIGKQPARGRIGVVDLPGQAGLGDGIGVAFWERRQPGSPRLHLPPLGDIDDRRNRAQKLAARPANGSRVHRHPGVSAGPVKHHDDVLADLASQGPCHRGFLRRKR